MRLICLTLVGALAGAVPQAHANGRLAVAVERPVLQPGATPPGAAGQPPLSGASPLIASPSLPGTVLPSLSPQPGAVEAPVLAPAAKSGAAVPPGLPSALLTAGPAAPALQPDAPSGVRRTNRASGDDRPLPDAAPKSLIETLSADMPDLGRLGETDASAAAESDFLARAKLGRGPPEEVPASALTPAIAAVPYVGLAPSRRAARLPASAPQTIKSPLPAPRQAAPDGDGGRMRETLKRLASAAGVIELDYTPSAKSLKALADFGRGPTRETFEVFLFRDRR
ncbi:MAG: hypothetical protein HY927_10850, partial [Elusimicrobia bacterium]|nr:hypothetical protein [Elusimicrobiota bacterium]